MAPIPYHATLATRTATTYCLSLGTYPIGLVLTVLNDEFFTSLLSLSGIGLF
jgi:hypothetical protein